MTLNLNLGQLCNLEEPVITNNLKNVSMIIALAQKEYFK